MQNLKEIDKPIVPRFAFVSNLEISDFKTLFYISLPYLTQNLRFLKKKEMKKVTPDLKSASSHCSLLLFSNFQNHKSIFKILKIIHFSKKGLVTMSAVKFCNVTTIFYLVDINI